MREWFAPGSGLFFQIRKFDLIQEFFRRQHQPTRDLRWLDVGCGFGELLRLGGNSFRSAQGCDPSTGMLEHCHDISIETQIDPCKLPYANCSFDFVTAVCVFHHVELSDRSCLTREIARVLTPGGYACIIEHNPFNPVTRAIVRRTPVDANASLLMPAMVSSLFLASGLEVKRTRFFLYLPESLYRLAPGLERLLALIPAGGQFATFARKPGQKSS
jgi:SAM-dependent methyltransferase